MIFQVTLTKMCLQSTDYIVFVVDVIVNTFIML